MYNIIQTVVTTAFCEFLRKKLRPRATLASTFPSPSLPSYLRRNSKRSLDFSRKSALIYRAWCDAADCFSDCFSLFLFFFLFRPKIVGRRTRVIGQGSKTWKGYRNSLFPFFLSFLSFVAISLLFFLSVLHLSFFSPLTALGEKKEIDLNVRDGR